MITFITVIVAFLLICVVGFILIISYEQALMHNKCYFSETSLAVLTMIVLVAALIILTSL